MTFINNFFAVYTGVFLTLYTYSISYEFNNLNNKIDKFQNEYNEYKKYLVKETKEKELCLNKKI